MISLLLRILFYPSPKIVFEKEEAARYEKRASVLEAQSLITDDWPYPKYRFLEYLSLKQEYVFHGSNNHAIDTFEPREQTLYNNEWTKAVFATQDPHWAIFFAVFNRSNLIGSFRNGCLIGRSGTYHYYSLNESTMKNHPWTEGTVYILPRNKFKPSGRGRIRFDEWICHEPVKPAGKLEVSIDDFFYKDKVAVHKEGESLLKTGVFYKARTVMKTNHG